jgi:hypothetical protein
MACCCCCVGWLVAAYTKLKAVSSNTCRAHAIHPSRMNRSEAKHHPSSLQICAAWARRASVSAM